MTNLARRPPLGQKHPPLVSTALRQSARGETCTLRLGCCNGDPSTTVLAHIRAFGWAGMAQKPSDFLAVINMRARVAIPKHVQPNRLIHEIINRIRRFDDFPRRARRRLGAPFIGQKLLEQLPPQIELQAEFILNPADDKFIVQFLFVGAFQIARRGDKRKALLMVVAGCVMIANVVIWIIPTQDQGSLLEAQQRGNAVK